MSRHWIPKQGNLGSLIYFLTASICIILHMLHIPVCSKPSRWHKTNNWANLQQILTKLYSKLQRATHWQLSLDVLWVFQESERLCSALYNCVAQCARAPCHSRLLLGTGWFKLTRGRLAKWSTVCTESFSSFFSVISCANFTLVAVGTFERHQGTKIWTIFYCWALKWWVEVDEHLHTCIASKKLKSRDSKCPLCVSGGEKDSMANDELHNEVNQFVANGRRAGYLFVGITQGRFTLV